MERCKTCRFWQQATNYESIPNSGLCHEIYNSDQLSINLLTGWEGGYVDSVETEETFGCVLHRENLGVRKLTDESSIIPGLIVFLNRGNKDEFGRETDEFDAFRVVDNDSFHPDIEMHINTVYEHFQMGKLYV